MQGEQTDKGCMYIRLKKTESGLCLCDMKPVKEPDENNLRVQYENGCIFIDWDDGSPKDVIGHYRRTTGITAPGTEYYDVLNKDLTCVIGKVGEEIIKFCKDNDGRPQEELLAFYTENGGITALSILPYVGSIKGSLIGGAAAFVAVFYTYRFKSVYHDFFEMDTETFKAVYKDYLRLF